MDKEPQRGFTIIELLIVIAVMLVLASSAIAGGMYILRMLKFNNVFNKVVLMVQNARSMAATEKGDSGIAAYSVNFTTGTPFTVSISQKAAVEETGTGTTTETFQLPRDFSMQIHDLTMGSSSCETSPSPSTPLAEIIFPKADRDIVMKCKNTDESSGSDPQEKIKLMQFSLSNAGPFGTTTKAFVIHKTTGMPQMR